MRDCPCVIASRICASQRHFRYHVRVTEGSYAGPVHSRLVIWVEEEDISHVCVEDVVQVVASISKAGEGTTASHGSPWRGTYRINPLKPNDLYMRRTAQLTSRCCILYIYSTNIRTEYFKHAVKSPFFPLQNAVYFIMLPFLVTVLFTF